MTKTNCNHSLTRHDYSALLIDLPDNLSKKIISWGKNNFFDDYLYVDFNDASYGRQIDLHITLLYGLHSNNHREMENIFTNTKPFECTLQEISLFENDKFDVLMIKVNSEELYWLNEKLSRTLDFDCLYTCYIPHVTIAYLKSGQAKKFVGCEIFKNQKFMVDNIVFSSKTKRKHKLKLGNL